MLKTIIKQTGREKGDSHMPEYTEEQLQELYLKNKKGDPEAREKIVNFHLPLVHALCKRYPLDTIEYEDIFQEGCLGLLKALKNFDPYRETKFSTYAVPFILGEIKSFLRRNGHLLKVSRTYHNHYHQLLQSRDDLQQKLKRRPRLEELAGKMGLSKEEIAWLMELQHPVMPLSEEGSVTGDTDSFFDRIFLKEKLSSLPPRERQIIVLRYFLEKSQEEVAKILGISQSHVSRLERKVIRQLREKS